MDWRTEIESETSPEKWNTKTQVVTLGSCFSDVIGNYLVQNKINCLANPFGVIFNIASIYEILQKTIFLDFEKEKERIITRDNKYFHFDFHSEIHHDVATQLETNLKNSLSEFNSFLKKTDYLIITLGTSWVYQLKNTNHVVANCHKQPARLFDKKLLSINHQLDIFKNIYTILKKLNPKLKIILTVSPVRHTKDSLSLNNVSKSILRVICHQIVSEYTDTYYFPAYEIMIDDLRDYRFYKDDLIHPTQFAEKYILEKFSDSWFGNDLKNFISKCKKVQLNLNHRPLSQNSVEYYNFQKQTLQLIYELKEDSLFESEIQVLKNSIAAFQNQNFQ